jgi:hypothetical protein
MLTVAVDSSDEVQLSMPPKTSAVGFLVPSPPLDLFDGKAQQETNPSGLRRI